jgi:beta-N-acetylhexosaminidase
MNGGATPFTVPDLTLRGKIAQLIFIRIGSNLPPVRRAEQDEERVESLLKDCPFGGLIVFNGGPGTKTTLQRMQAVSKVPLLVGCDIERGVGQHVQGYTLFPHAMALGRQRSNIDRMLDVTAKEAHDVGIHITFAPVADVNTNPLNPIISIRAFSDNVEVAAAHTAHYVRLAETSGLLTTAKHFPGHGDTHQDSHDSMPSVNVTLDELRSRELVPFRAAIEAGCSLIMTAHVAFPSVDPSGMPATLSPRIMHTLLRDEMGFKGVVCSDSLLMTGVCDRFNDEGEMALATLNAGVDLLLDLREPTMVVDYLLSCVRSGKLLEARVNEAYSRVAALKQKAFSRHSTSRPLPAETPSDGTADPLSADFATIAAREAIEVLHCGSPALPLNPDLPLTAILLKPFETRIDPPEQPLAAALRERFRNVKYEQLGPNADSKAYEAALAIAETATQLVLAVVVRPAAWHNFQLRPEQKAFVRQVVRSRKDVVLASLGVPYVLQEYPEAAVRICAYSDVPASQQALADFILA